MKNVDSWLPTKFEKRHDTWRASRNKAEVMPSSRLMGDRIAEAYSRLIRDYASGDLLDLGCGSVPLYAMYRDQVDSVTCADWSNSLHGRDHLDFEVDLNADLPFGDQAFDTIVLTDVLEHLPYPDRLWPELRRVLKPGGRALVGVPFFYWLHEVPFDFHRYTEYRLKLFCTDHNLLIDSLGSYGSPTDVVFDVTAKLLTHYSFTTRFAGPVASFGEFVGRPLLQRRTPMPLGYVLVARRPESSP